MKAMCDYFGCGIWIRNENDVASNRCGDEEGKHLHDKCRKQLERE